MKANMIIAGIVALGMVVPGFAQDKKPEPPKAEVKKEEKKDVKKDPGLKEEKKPDVKKPEPKPEPKK